MTRNVFIRRAGVAIVMVVALAACSSSKSSTPPPAARRVAPRPAAGQRGGALAKAEAATQLAFKGTNRNVDPQVASGQQRTSTSW